MLLQFYPDMQTVTLGKTNCTISRVGLGGLAFGGHLGDITRTEVIRTIQAALEGGITLFDSSPAYGAGMAEELLGEALGYDRDRVTIATGIGAGIDSTGQFWCLNNRANILRQVDGSLKRLRREYVDIYFVPGDDPTTPLAETVEAMEELRARGRIKLIGYCTSSVDTLREALKHGKIDVVQTPYNIFSHSVATGLIPFCRATHIPILACEPFCRGLLTGMLNKHSSFDADDLRIEDKRFRGEQYRRHIEDVNRLRTIAEQEGLSLIQLALGWILQNPTITGTICGAKSRLQIRQSILASDAELTPETVIAIDQIVGATVAEKELRS